ncbi:hypothetical protein [Rhizobium sp. Leaf262]|uniref:hypothetical protein n=1 Tax=Rhizobium sp. Leaf262 TaxID=1736312 RepID=UPI000713C18F|nr:hypothetical protein [Rhizobium sp. Leaf262]KQO80087.1 hypothetical protein ASF29_21385 [Rhizobium sp. Leaf262]
MIFVSGPSGTGKTTALQRFIERNSGFTLLRASSILKVCGRPTHNLTFEELDENQVVLRKWLNRGSFGSATIWDGHTVIPCSEGLFYLPLKFFAGLPIHALIFLQTDPSVLATRAGLNDSCTAQLAELQDIELVHMREVAESLKCQFAIIPSSNPILLEEALLQYGIIPSSN